MICWMNVSIRVSPALWIGPPYVVAAASRMVHAAPTLRLHSISKKPAAVSAAGLAFT
jgi:hypothetical protein